MVAPLWTLNTIKHLCSPKKWTKVHQKFLGDATPKDLPSCQISSRSVKAAWRKTLKRYPVRSFPTFFLSRTDRNVTILESRLAACERRD